jgi:hypothetical protein
MRANVHDQIAQSRREEHLSREALSTPCRIKSADDDALKGIHGYGDATFINIESPGVQRYNLAPARWGYPQLEIEGGPSDSKQREVIAGHWGFS